MTEAPLIRPLDEHNRELIRHVHPPEWEPPRPAERYHLVVVGAGTGGLVTAAIAAGLGARVALVERRLMGGDCLNVGCVPSKAVIRAARAWEAAREARERFGGPAVSGDGDFAAVMERMRRIRADISHVDGAARFRELGVDVFLGDARFASPDTVEVNGEPLRFRRAVVATGSHAAAPDLPGLEDAGYLTNETLFELMSLPERLVVIGGGPIGCEMAQAFVRFGSRVTLVERADRLLMHDDPDAADVIRRAFDEDGIELLFGADVERVERRGDERVVRYRRGDGVGEAAGDALLVAIGRAPSLDGLGLEKAGVRYDRTGIETDDRLQTTNGSVFAVGDVASKYQFTHVADAHARMVVRNALFFGRGKASDLVIPWCTYTSPELAHVGIGWEEVRERGEEVETITIPLDEVDRARLDGETEGFLRIHLAAGSECILGATLVAEHAGEIISQVTAAMVAGKGLETLGATIFPYPTQAEVIRRAADAARRRKLTPLAKSVFGSYFRVLS